jgi:23S rRNA (pseudouridine1915-N3)-methyltransferase
LRVTLLAVGRLRDPNLLALYEDYAQRLARGPFGRPQLRELELRGRIEGPDRLSREASLIRENLPSGACLVTLDSRGKDISSRGLADFVARQQLEGRQDLVFVIGGAEGIDPKIRKMSDLVLSMGKMTWPHLLVRIMLIEQLYRVQCIHGNHPYHRD